MTYEITKEMWHTCKICGGKIIDLAKKYGGSGTYYTEVFDKHLKLDHNIDHIEYFTKVCKLNPPTCPCGVCNKPLGISNNRGPFRWKKYSCGRNPGQKQWSEEAKTTRLGAGNPMFQETPWNKGLTKETNEIVNKVSRDRIGTKASPETCKKLAEAMYRRLNRGELPPHTGHKHSKEICDKLREKTLKMHKEGKFRRRSTPHIRMCEILSEMNIIFEEEKTVHYFSFDIYIPIIDTYIEVDGDYFHTNPKFYPNGPKTKTQKVNLSNDKRKNTYCKNRNIKLIRFWENDILNNPEEIKCKVKELLGLEV